MNHISIPQKAIDTIKEAIYKQERIKSDIAAYANGLKEGLGISEGWQLDIQTKSFVCKNSDSPQSSIPLSLQTIAVIENFYRKLEEIDSQLKCYKIGLFHALGVPDHWEIDFEKKIIVDSKKE